RVQGRLGALLASAPAGPLHTLPILYLPPDDYRQRALENVRRRVALGGVRGDEAFSLSHVAIETGQYDLARAIVAEWERQAPGNLSALRKRADVELRAGAYGPALRAIDAILKQKPDDEEALRWQALAVAQIRRQAEKQPPE